MDRCGVFLEADPLSKKDVIVMQEVSKMFGHVDVFLERKYCTCKSLLSYDEKVDVMRHDSALSSISWQVHPIDKSKHDAMLDAGVKHAAIAVSSSSDMKNLHERACLCKQLVAGSSVMFVPIDNAYDVDSLFLHQLVAEDTSKAVCMKHMTEYAYFKLKMKLTKKVAIECPPKMQHVVAEVLEDRADQFACLAADCVDDDTCLRKALGKLVLDTPCKCAIAYASSIERLKPYVDVQVFFGKHSGLHIDSGDEASVKRSLIALLNSKLKPLKSIC